MWSRASPAGLSSVATSAGVLLRAEGAPREALGELLLYLADRHQHLEEVIRPALRRGLTVISDRYHDATRAYQGAGRGIPLEVIDELARILRIPDPDLTILLDLDPEIAIARARSRDQAAGRQDEGRFEAEELAFHASVRAAYLALAQNNPRRIRIIPAHGTAQEVFKWIEPILIDSLCLKGNKPS